MKKRWHGLIILQNFQKFIQYIVCLDVSRSKQAPRRGVHPRNKSEHIGGGFVRPSLCHKKVDLER